MSSAYAPSEEREVLRESVRGLLSRYSNPRLVADGGHDGPTYDADLWRRLAQIGIPGLLIPEDWNGSGATVTDVMVVMEELGAALAPVPVLSTVGLVTPVLRLLGAAEVANRVAAGETAAAIVVDPLTDPWSSGEKSHVHVNSSGLVDGKAEAVLDGAAADLLIVVAPGSEGHCLLAVDVMSENLTVERLTSLDLTRGLARVRFQGVKGEVLACGSGVVSLVESGLDVGLVLQAAELVGLAQRRHDEAVAYAKERVQFGRPIGSFQAVKHLLVDLLLDLELARSAMIAAAGAADAYLADPTPATAGALRADASLAAATCKEMAFRVARETLHVFGGIGFTWEHDSHLAFRRAKASELLLGDPGMHRRRMVGALRD